MLNVQNLSKRFGDLNVLDSLSLEVAEGEIVALVGPSGCGKSTLLNIVAGLVPCDAGTVETGGARIGYVFQEDRLLPWLTVAENIAVVGEKERAGEAADWIAMVGLEGFADYYPDELSGGMRQRCAIARAYHFQSGLLLMDEPFKSLDLALRREMLEALLQVWHGRRNTIVFVTHDVDEATAIASRVLVLGDRPARVRAEFSLEAADGLRDPEQEDVRWVRQEIANFIGGRWMEDVVNM